MNEKQLRDKVNKATDAVKLARENMDSAGDHNAAEAKVYWAAIKRMMKISDEWFAMLDAMRKKNIMAPWTVSETNAEGYRFAIMGTSEDGLSLPVIAKVYNRQIAEKIVSLVNADAAKGA